MTSIGTDDGALQLDSEDPLAWIGIASAELIQVARAIDALDHDRELSAEEVRRRLVEDVADGIERAAMALAIAREKAASGLRGGG